MKVSFLYHGKDVRKGSKRKGVETFRLGFAKENEMFDNYLPNGT